METSRPLIRGEYLKALEENPLRFSNDGRRLRMKPIMNGASAYIYAFRKDVIQILSDESGVSFRTYPVRICYGKNNEIEDNNYEIFQNLTWLDAIDVEKSDCKVGILKSRNLKVCWDFKRFVLDEEKVGKHQIFYLEGVDPYLFVYRDLWEKIKKGKKKSDFTNLNVLDLSNEESDLNLMNLYFSYDKDVRRGDVELLRDNHSGEGIL